MPLPFAPPPSESKLYSDLKNLKLSEVTADQFDSLKTALFAQGVDSSEDEMRRLNLVGQASNQQSASGPMPDTGRIEELVSESSGIQTLFRPDAGEVWQLTGVSTGSAVNATIVLHLYDGVTKVELGQETGVNVVFNPFTLGVVYVDNSTWLAADYSSNSGETRCVAGFIRVR